MREDAPPYRVPTLNSALRFIDLFCGIGGFRLAFERAGARCVFSSDWDKFSRQTYAANFGETPHGDIHSVAVADIPKFDMLCGGFPCQPFSFGKLPAGDSRENPAKAQPACRANESFAPRKERSSAQAPVAEKTS